MTKNRPISKPVEDAARRAADRRALALELMRELVRVTVERWDIEHRIETELGNNAELEFLPGSPLYDGHISDNAVACLNPEDAVRVVDQEDANAFLLAVTVEAEAFHAGAEDEETAK